VLQGTVDGGAVEAIPRLPTAGGHGIVGFPRFGRSNWCKVEKDTLWYTNIAMENHNC
jgi:hypothetical protein